MSAPGEWAGLLFNKTGACRRGCVQASGRRRTIKESCSPAAVCRVLTCKTEQTGFFFIEQFHVLFKMSLFQTTCEKTPAAEKRVKRHKAVRRQERAVLNATSPDGWQFLILWHPESRTGPHTSWFRCRPDGKLQTVTWLETWQCDTEQIFGCQPIVTERLCKQRKMDWWSSVWICGF